MIIGNFSNSLSTPLRDFNKQKEDLIQRNYNHIYAHELAHKVAGGSFAGAISIEKNSEGIPVSGHVPIKMPVLDKNNSQKTIDDADVVIKAALAPSDPSSQDYKVAAEAQSIKDRAKSLKTGNKLDLMA